MKLRVGLALLVVTALTAFAPAPFPKSGRRGQQPEITLDTFQGRWRVTKMQSSRANGQHTPYNWNVTHIRVTKDRWEFASGNAGGSGGLFISIDPAKRPAHLNFYNRAGDKTIYGVGQIRRQGSKIQVIYTWGGENVRPTFDPPVERGWIITMERD
jgi:uncharacterized protein (TIGR03067 family)